MQRIICCLLICLWSVKGLGQTSIGDLKVEYLKNPIGIDVSHPRFSWKMFSENNQHGLFQAAYQIKVTNESNQLVWNSGKVISDTSLNVEYLGDALEAETKYTWDLTVWDQDHKKLEKTAFFETGIMNPKPNLEGWEGAKWIGGAHDDLALYAHALSVFKVSYSLRLDKDSNSQKAGFLFGANDVRLKDKNLNILGVENTHNNSYFVFQLDISKVDDSGGVAYLNIFRKGYDKNDQANTPLFSYQIPKRLINSKNKYDWHKVYFEMNFGKCLIYINGIGEEHVINEDPNVPSWVDVRGVSLNPLGDNGGDLVVYPVLGDIGFKMDEGEQADFKNVRITNFRKPSNSLFEENLTESKTYNGIFKNALNKGLKIENGSYHVGNDDSTVLLTADPSKNSAPLLRTTFNLKKDINKARLYVTARGIYEVHLNGKRVGDDYFNPGLTQYNKTHMYQTYDVTEQLAKEKNALGVILSEGWWSGNSTYRGYNWNYFGDRQSLLLKLKVTYKDGTSETITSNDSDWKLFVEGPIRYSSFFQGELYDARKEDAITKWSTVNYDDSNWKPAVEVPLSSENVYLSDNFNYDDLKIMGQIGENAKIVKTLQAKSVEEVRPGVFVYDMGQNMVGFPQIKLKGKTGDTITMRYAEVRYPNLPEHAENVDMIMMENIRGALSTDRWILKNYEEEVIQPHFTFHGYRYLEVSGIKEALPLEHVKGMVVSSIQKLSSSYKTSNELVNKLWENITWSFRSNFLSIPTDTPARNERMGWNGDINVFSKTATYLGDVNPFLNRHLIANRDLQEKSGRFPDIAPVGTGFGGTLWGSAGVTIPWNLYKQYGDKNILKNHYTAMKAYLDFLAAKQDAETGILDEGPLGDWLSPEGFKNDNSMLWTAYQIMCLEILYKSAGIIEKKEDANLYRANYKNRKQFFNDTYVDAVTGKTIHSGYSGQSLATKPPGYTMPQKGDLVDTQASYAIPLAFNVFNDKNRKRAQNHLVETVKRKNKDYQNILRPEISLMTGFIGTAALAPALSKSGHSDLAYKLLQQTTYPSWLYSVTNGATTIWERLNSYTKENGFGGNNSMNSFNHYSFGAIGEWMYAYSLGIQPQEPGYKSIILKPTPDKSGQMKWAKGYYNSMYGNIESKWEVDGDKTTYLITIPPNTNAKVQIQCSENQNLEFVTEGKLKNALQYKNVEGGRREYSLGSGAYKIVVK